MRRRWKGLIALITAGCVLSTLAGVGLAGGFSPQARIGAPAVSNSKAARLSAGVAQATGAEIAAFPILGTPTTATDEAADSDSSLLSSLQSGQDADQVNPSLGRLALSNSQAVIDVVPGAGTVCAAVSTQLMGTQTACNSLAAASSSGLVVGGGVDGTQQLVAGVLPGTAQSLKITMASGPSASVPVSSGGGFEYETTDIPQSLIYTDATGTHHTIVLGH